MFALFCFVLAVLTSLFKSKSRLEAENAALRHQLIVLRRKVHGRVHLTNNDRWFLIQLYRWFPSILQVATIVQPETLVRWHRAGFRRYWCWKSRRRGGRPQVEADLRALIRRMSIENPLWGAPRIHGELLKLGFEVAQSSVAKYMVKRLGPPNQGWRTFLRNHAPDIAAVDLFVVPTIGFDLLYAFVIVRLDRRDLVWINVTTNPTAEWIACQLTEAFPWHEAPQYLIRDRDRILWHCCHSPIVRHGHPGQAYSTGFTLAEWLCRTADRIDPARVRGPFHRLERGPFAPHPASLRSLLQRQQDASLIGQRCAGLAPGSAGRINKFIPNPWRASSPICSDLGFRYTQPPLPLDSPARAEDDRPRWQRSSSPRVRPSSVLQKRGCERLTVVGTDGVTIWPLTPILLLRRRHCQR